MRNWQSKLVSRALSFRTTVRIPSSIVVSIKIYVFTGGRQYDGATGSLTALPDIVKTVGDNLTVLFDSGIRNGADIMKALALGAKAVLVGRPIIYGLSVSGEQGAEHVMRCLLAVSISAKSPRPTTSKELFMTLV